MLTIKNPKTFDWANMALSDCCEGNAADSYFTLKLFNLIEEKIKDLGMEKLLTKLIMPSLSTFAEMEFEGMQVSESKLDEVGRHLRVSNIEEEDNLYAFKQLVTSDNLSSNNDLIEILLPERVLSSCTLLIAQGKVPLRSLLQLLNYY